MNPRDGSGAAFPGPGSFEGTGLTKREWLAGQALAGLHLYNSPNAILLDETAKTCVRYADAVLEELGK